MKLLKALMAIAALGASVPAGAIEVDGIAARVGSDTILRSDILNEMFRMGETDPSVYARVRNQMIDRRLILKAASASKMTMQEWVVENRAREIIDKAFDGDRNKLVEMLGRQKITYPEWYARLKDDLIVGAMRWNVIDKNVTASPAAMRKEYESHPERYTKEPTVTVSAILLKPEDASKRDEVSAALRDKPFDEIARLYSSDAKASEGGLWKDVKPEDCFRPEICAEIEKMPKGTISHWIVLDDWSYLLRKDSATEARRLPFAEAYDLVEANVKEEEAKRLYTAWMERLREETYIRVY